MNPAPLPQPAARTCPNCGAPVSDNVALCPNCGAPLAPSQGGSCLIIAAQLFLSFLSLIFGLGGACIVFLSGIEGGVASRENLVFALMGLGAVALSGACIWAILRLNRRRK